MANYWLIFLNKKRHIDYYEYNIFAHKNLIYIVYVLALKCNYIYFL